MTKPLFESEMVLTDWNHSTGQGYTDNQLVFRSADQWHASVTLNIPTLESLKDTFPPDTILKITIEVAP